MTPADLERVHALAVAAFDHSWSIHELAVELKLSRSIALVAELDGDVVGFVLVRVILDEAEVFRIAVDPPVRSLGLGRELMDAALARATAAGASRVLLEVRTDNVAALALYGRLGFLEVGRRAHYYPDGADAILMTKET